MEKLIAAWHWLTSSRYTRFLERERERLLDEQRQLTNAMLAHAGMPQIGPRLTKPMKPLPGRTTPSQLRNQFESQDRKNAERTTQ